MDIDFRDVLNSFIRGKKSVVDGIFNGVFNASAYFVRLNVELSMHEGIALHCWN